MNANDRALDMVLRNGTYDMSEAALKLAAASTRNDGPEDRQARAQAREALAG